MHENHLLDLYPNSLAAFSLRKLGSGYTGNLIRIRRSLDDQEQKQSTVDSQQSA